MRPEGCTQGPLQERGLSEQEGLEEQLWQQEGLEQQLWQQEGLEEQLWQQEGLEAQLWLVCYSCPEEQQLLEQLEQDDVYSYYSDTNSGGNTQIFLSCFLRTFGAF